jgi:murein DD-endopeptidase MepM/ murein hydrolase activator NlpD
MTDLKRKLAVLIAVIACYCQPAGAYRPARRRPASRPVSQDVLPSPEIETHIAEAVSEAKRILDDLNAGNFLASPHLVSAIYYHDGFLTDYSVDRANADPERRIIGQISNLLPTDGKARFMQLLHEAWAQSDPAGPQRLAEPVAYSAVGGSRTHRYAVDLFAREGAAVRAVSRGIVVLADGNWDPANLFSTTSRKGGNSVIVFDPDHDRFYRYCHMDAVDVSAGKLVAAGEAVGSVGHSGLNASQPGHGRHLHFETNQYLEGRVRAIEYRQLRTLLRQWRSAAGVQGGKDKLPERSKTQNVPPPSKQ